MTESVMGLAEGVPSELASRCWTIGETPRIGGLNVSIGDTLCSASIADAGLTCGAALAEGHRQGLDGGEGGCVSGGEGMQLRVNGCARGRQGCPVQGTSRSHCRKETAKRKVTPFMGHMGHDAAVIHLGMDNNSTSSKHLPAASNPHAEITRLELTSLVKLVMQQWGSCFHVVVVLGL